MKFNLGNELMEIFNEIKIESPIQFTFCGQTFSQEVKQYLPYQPNTRIENIIPQLQNQLYNHCYTRRFSGERPEYPTVTTYDESFISKLSRANKGVERWEAGWTYLQTDQAGNAQVRKGELIRWFAKGHYQVPNQQMTGETNLQVYIKKESKNSQPGFYVVLGTVTKGSFSSDRDIFRLYWNINPEGAPILIEAISKTLNHYRIPFRFKCPIHPDYYYRRDAGVLYLNKKYFQILSILLHDFLPGLKKYLNHGVPLFSKYIRDGIGLAEDPANNESFGMNRCRIVAEGLLNAFYKGKQDPQSRLAEVENHFKAYGMDLNKAYLNAGSSDIYSSEPILAL